MKIALLIIDVQNDFCPKGALEVKNGDEIIPYINTIAEDCGYDYVITTQDYHPVNHCSFASANGVEAFTETKDGMMWPDHCVVGTEGVKLHKDLTKKADANFLKAVTYDVDSYSGFGGSLEGANEVSLDQWLKERDVTFVDVVGLATDFCVKATALDAVKLGYKTSVIDRGTKAVVEKQSAYIELTEGSVNVVM